MTRAMIPVAALASLVAGSCSADAVKRSAYETAQNVGRQQCRDAQAAPCNEHVDYETYEREREEALSKSVD